MKDKFSVLGKSIIILISGGMIGVLLLAAAFCIPVNSEKAKASLEMKYLEGQYPRANGMMNTADAYFYSFESTVLDNVTDYLMIETALMDSEEANPFILAVDMDDYARYWHGYIVLLRPLLYVMEYMDLRVLNSFLQMILTVLIAVEVWKQTEKKSYVLAFATSYVLLMPMAIFSSLQYSWVFYIAFIGTLLAMRKKDYLLQKSHYVYFFLFLGMLTTYFDLLTYPLVTWGLPLIWWLVAAGNAMNAKEKLKKIIISGISWIAGYSVFWIMKWVIATLILGYNIIADAMNEAIYRVGEVDKYLQASQEAYDRWEVLYANWRHYEDGFFAVFLVAWVLWAVFHSVWNGWKPKGESVPYLLIVGSSAVWYLALSNHTTIHHIFTYRIYVVSILAFIIFLIESVQSKKGVVEKITWKQRFIRFMAWGLLAVIGYGLTSFAKEDVFAVYGTEYQEVPLKEGDLLETSFIPTFSNIRNIGFCLSDAEGEGYYHVTILEEKEVLYQEEIPLSGHVEEYFYMAEVDWDLEANKEYRLQISVHENEEAMIFITNPGNMPLNEYRNLAVNEAALEGQPLGGVNYHATIQSRLRRSYSALMWMILLGGIFAAVNINFPLKKLTNLQTKGIL